MKILLNNLFTKEDETRNINMSGFSSLASEAVVNLGMLSNKEATRRKEIRKDIINNLGSLNKTVKNPDPLNDNFYSSEKRQDISVYKSIKSILARKEKVLRGVSDRTKFNKDFEREFRNQLSNFGTDEQTIQKVLLGIRTSLSTNLQPELRKGLVAMDNKISNNLDAFDIKSGIAIITKAMLDFLDSYDPHNEDKNKRQQPRQSAETIINKYITKDILN